MGLACGTRFSWVSTVVVFADCLALALGSIIAAAYTMALDGGNYLVIPTGIIVLWDAYYLARRANITPRMAITTDAIAMVLTFAWAIVYMIITFSNVGQPDDGCGFDPEWCKNMTRVSAAEGSSTLLLFPLSLVHLILMIIDIRASQHTQGRHFNGTPLNEGPMKTTV